MANLRSPNYPAIGLPEAITKARAVYDKEFNHPGTREVMVKAMGYGGINGASSTVFSALTKYGLLENVGSDQYKVSTDALDIFLHQRGEAPRRVAIEKLAFAPPLFAELREIYGRNRPSDDNLRATLIKRGFNPKTVGDAIRAYRDTVELVEAELEGYNPAGGKNISQEGTPIMHQQSTQAPPTAQQYFSHLVGDGMAAPLAENETELKFNISQDSKARIVFSGNVTQEAIDLLAEMLKIQKRTFPKEDEMLKKSANKESIRNISESEDSQDEQ